MGDGDDYYYGSISVSDDLEGSEYDEENGSEFRVLGAGRFQMVVENPEEMRDLWRWSIKLQSFSIKWQILKM